MGRKRVRQKPIQANEFRKLIGDAKAFREATFFVENRIKKLGASSDSSAPLSGNRRGWPSADVWASLKTVSHFNLHNAFELGLKAFLGSLGVPFSETHFLKGLYSTIPEKEVDKVEALFSEISEKHPNLELRALMRKETPPTKRPKAVRLNRLKDFCEYFDTDVALWRKRYAWENASKGKWEHYLSTLDIFLAFLDKLEQQSIEN